MFSLINIATVDHTYAAFAQVPEVAHIRGQQRAVVVAAAVNHHQHKTLAHHQKNHPRQLLTPHLKVHLIAAAPAVMVT